MAASILIADDDAVQRRLVDNILQKCGYETIVVDSGDAAVAALMTADAPPIDAVILDLVMPGLDGMGVLIKIREAGLNIPVIVQTAHGGIDNVVSAMRAGAQDFVVKPAGIERLQVSLRNVLNASALKGELQRIRHSREGRLTFADIITRSENMTGVLHIAQKAAASTIPVLIEGESGVGKELFARAIHGSSERKSKPFVAVNCGAIPDNLVESILFGHEKGAFTGATDRHTGKFVEASGGTLFLDEVGELPPAAQVKLLRAIQEGEVEPVGARKPVKVDARIISATNRDLAADVAAGGVRAGGPDRGTSSRRNGRLDRALWAARRQLAADGRKRRGPPARGAGDRGDSLCGGALSRANVGGGAPPADRPLHALPQARSA